MAEQELAKPLPHDDLMERTVLGAILAEHRQAFELVDTLHCVDFFDNRHRRILDSMRRLQGAGKMPSLPSVYDDLHVRGELEAAGGVAYLSSIADGLLKNSKDMLSVAKRLRDLSAYREIVHVTDYVQNMAFERAGVPTGLLEHFIERLSEMARDIESDEEDGETYFDASLRALASLKEGPRLKIFTDVDRLDQWTGGFREGELILISAETGTGKSLLAQQIRSRACCDGHPALFCSGEMTAEHLAKRQLAPDANVAPIKMRREDLLTDEDWNELVEAASHQCKKCRILDGELELSRIRRAARRMKARDGLDLVILDYDELISAPGGNEIEQQKNIARAAKSIGMELKCAVILISQLRKTLSGEDAARPTLQRLYGSGAKQKHASYIILADRPFVRKLEGNEKEAKLWVLKSRDGRTGKINATFNVKKLRFDEAPQEDPASD